MSGAVRMRFCFLGLVGLTRSSQHCAVQCIRECHQEPKRKDYLEQHDAECLISGMWILEHRRGKLIGLRSPNPGVNQLLRWRRA
mmetsp:Transcript_132079/g.240329  ORF Transcript_132079/g.240329 Transcript_132079/m.240329 type:complete len:84 (-) Transcript_132079:10-261(-)